MSNRNFDDTSFDPFDFLGGDDEFKPEFDEESDDITDLDQLYEYEDYDFEDLQSYEFHGTADT